MAAAEWLWDTGQVSFTLWALVSILYSKGVVSGNQACPALLSSGFTLWFLSPFPVLFPFLLFSFNLSLCPEPSFF